MGSNGSEEVFQIFSLHITPNSNEDIQRSIELINDYTNGRYGFKRDDISYK